MKYCEECGSKLEKDSMFCEECGTKVTDVKDVTTPEVSQKSSSVKKIEIKPLSKTQKIIGASVVSAAVLLFAGYHIGSSVYSEENQKNQLIEALVAKDADALAKVVSTTDPNFEVSPESLAPFVAYLDENPNYLSQLTNNLMAYGEFDSFYISQNGSRLGLYDGYDLNITPVYATVYTNADGVVISANDEEWITSSSEDFNREIGPLAPGIHSFHAEGEVNGYTLTASEEVSWLYPNDYHEVDLILRGLEFSISSDLKDANVYLNDKEIGKLEDGYGDFGPIQWESGMEIYVGQTFGEEEVKSEPVALESYDDYYYFNGLSLTDDYELERILSNMYSEVSSLSRWYEDDTLESLSNTYDPEGPAYELQRNQFVSFAEGIYNNDEINNVYFDVTLIDYEQVGAKTFDVEYEVTYTTSYDWYSDREDQIRHYSKDATIVFEPTNNPYRDYDIMIHEISNEELLYEEGGN